MAATVVVREHLSQEMISAGEDLTLRLDVAGWPLTASFWLYLPEIAQWRMVLAPPRVIEVGPKEAYRQIQEVLSHVPEEEPTIPLQSIAVAEPSNPLISLRAAVQTEDGVSGIWFSRNVINGHLIEDAYIYRMK